MDFSEVGTGEESLYDAQRVGRKLEAEATSKALGLSHYLYLTIILDLILQLDEAIQALAVSISPSGSQIMGLIKIISPTQTKSMLFSPL